MAEPSKGQRRITCVRQPRSGGTLVKRTAYAVSALVAALSGCSSLASMSATAGPSHERHRRRDSRLSRVAERPDAIRPMRAGVPACRRTARHAAPGDRTRRDTRRPSDRPRGRLTSEPALDRNVRRTLAGDRSGVRQACGTPCAFLDGDVRSGARARHRASSSTSSRRCRRRRTRRGEQGRRQPEALHRRARQAPRRGNRSSSKAVSRADGRAPRHGRRRV